MLLHRLLVGIALLALPASAFAQDGGTGHLYAYRLSDRAAFEAGYRKHLAWHARAGDKLVWYGWYVVSGDRAGAFVDGTFGTTPEALASRPDPDGDGADFRANAAAFSATLGNERWELWREASTATTLEQRAPVARIAVHAFLALDQGRFEAAVRARKLPGAAWYRAPGQGAALYLLVAPSTGTRRPTPPRLAGGRAIRSETWRYAPRLSLFPGRPLAP